MSLAFFDFETVVSLVAIILAEIYSNPVTIKQPNIQKNIHMPFPVHMYVFSYPDMSVSWKLHILPLFMFSFSSYQIPGHYTDTDNSHQYIYHFAPDCIQLNLLSIFFYSQFSNLFRSIYFLFILFCRLTAVFLGILA